MCALRDAGERARDALTFTVDNDVFTGSDNNYTNGLGDNVGISRTRTYDDDRFVSKWGRFWSFLPFVGDDGYTTYASGRLRRR